MLSREEKQQIQREEVAAAQAALARQQEQKRREARWAYRREVRATLKLRARARTGIAALLTAPVLFGVLTALLWPALFQPAPAAPDDTAGGVASSELMTRCEAALRTQVTRVQVNSTHVNSTHVNSTQVNTAQMNGNAGELRFPDLRDAAAQITASPDGKRWDGSFRQAGSSETTDFSCTFTVATGEISTELITP